MNLLDIGVLAKSSGVPASTLRYYEQMGLIAPVARHGLRRQYDPQVLTELALIGLGKAAGFSLEQIKSMLEDQGSAALPRPRLHERADEIDRQIRGLRTLSQALRHVAQCPAPSHLQCPRFQRLMQRVLPGAPPARPSPSA